MIKQHSKIKKNRIEKMVEQMDVVGEEDAQRTTHSLEVAEVINDIKVHNNMQTSDKSNKEYRSKQTNKMMSTTKNLADMATREVEKQKAIGKCLQPLKPSYLPNSTKPLTTIGHPS